MGRKVFEHICECTGIRVKCFVWLPAGEESCIHTGVQCPVKYSLSWPLWSLSGAVPSLPGGSGHSLLEAKQRCKRVLCVVSCWPEFLQSISLGEMTRGAECVNCLYIFSWLFFVVKLFKKPNQPTKPPKQTNQNNKQFDKVPATSQCCYAEMTQDELQALFFWKLFFQPWQL